MNYSDIISGYAEKRAINEQKSRDRMAECVSVCPEIGSLSGEITDLYYELAGCPIFNKDPEPVKKKIGELTVKRAALLKSNGFSEDYLLPIYDCRICRDSGFTDGNYCECVKRALISARIDELDIANDADFSAFDETLYTGAADVKKYFEKAVADYPAGYITYVLSDGTGTGKTFLLKCIARAFAKKGVPPLYITSNAMFSRFHEHRLSRGGDISDFFGAPVLLIDDLGSEPVTYNVTVEYFYNLINDRHEKKLFTFIATNLTNQELAERYGRRTASRLLDRKTAATVRLSGKDLRLK